MFKQIALFAAMIYGTSGAQAQENLVIDAMETPSFKATADKAVVESVEGRDGKALKFSFVEGAKSVFAGTRLRPTAAWDEANGFTF